MEDILGLFSPALVFLGIIYLVYLFETRYFPLKSYLRRQRKRRKNKMLFKFSLYPQYCCEESEDYDDCDEIVHNHFYCPICKNTNAGTDIYGEFYEVCGGDIKDFSCEECGAIFQLIKGSPYFEGTWAKIGNATKES